MNKSFITFKIVSKPILTPRPLYQCHKVKEKSTEWCHPELPEWSGQVVEG
ncbi:hypothetical protein ABIB40_001954 [Pedobacter sp. UYP30]